MSGILSSWDFWQGVLIGFVFTAVFLGTKSRLRRPKRRKPSSEHWNEPF